MFFHNKVMGARLYPKNKYEKQRVIVACWMEEASNSAYRPSFVVMGLSSDGEALKITFPSEEWMLHLEGVTDHQSILTAFMQVRKT